MSTISVGPKGKMDTVKMELKRCQPCDCRAAYTFELRDKSETCKYCANTKEFACLSSCAFCSVLLHCAESGGYRNNFVLKSPNELIGADE